MIEQTNNSIKGLLRGGNAMKLAAQAEFYIEKLGLDKGIEALKKAGYSKLIYTLDIGCLNKFSDSDFQAIRNKLEKEGLSMPFTIFSREIYLDHAPGVYEARKDLCLKAVRATALMGCKIIGVQPVCFRQSTPDAYEQTKELTYKIYSEIKEEADKADVKLAFINTSKRICFTSGTYSYGCRAKELLELADTFGAGIIIDPVAALQAGERVDELLVGTREKLVGFCMNDIAQREMTKTFPMFGRVDYYELIRLLQDYDSDAVAVMMHTPIINRYSDFIENEALVETITNVYCKMGCLISGCHEKSERE